MAAERKRSANKQLKDALDKRQQLENELLIKDYALESAATGIAIANLEGNVTYANPALLQMGGYEHAEVLGKHASLFFENEKEVQAALRASA